MHFYKKGYGDKFPESYGFLILVIYDKEKLGKVYMPLEIWPFDSREWLPTTRSLPVPTSKVRRFALLDHLS